MPNNNNKRGKMSVSEAGKKGGEKTSQTHGREFYQEIGHKGGEASPGKFAPGSRRAKEAGRKGGQR